MLLPRPGAAPLPPVAELAEHIKALRAAHTVEATPQRFSARSVAAAEEPVTARIHRQTGAVSSPRPQSEPEVTASPSVPSPRLAEPAAAAESTEPAPVVIAFPNTAHEHPVQQRTVYRERVGRDRRRNSRQLSLF